MKIEFKKNYCPNLFSWKELENLVNINPLMNVKRVNIIDSPPLSWKTDCWAMDVNCYPPSLLRSLMENHVCYFNEMSRCTEKINNFSHEIELEYGSAVDAHIYMCKNTSLVHPFGIHYDYCHNIIVQCEGVTNFKVWDIGFEKNKEDNRSNLNITIDPFLDVEMYPGDTIFIPAYVPHLADSKTQRLSISFPFHEKKSEYLQDRTWIKL